MDLMIDIETLGTGPTATILTIAAQVFDPLGEGFPQHRHFYARVDTDSQPNRTMDNSTLEWWAQQPEIAKNEAFSEEGRVHLASCLESLGKLIWQANKIWANGPTFDMNILEHAFKEAGQNLPWMFYNVRDARTVYALYPDLSIPPTTHHALEDCRRQITMLQNTLKFLNIIKLK
jgi:hypothetical protein